MTMTCVLRCLALAVVCLGSAYAQTINDNLVVAGQLTATGAATHQFTNTVQAQRMVISNANSAYVGGVGSLTVNGVTGGRASVYLGGQSSSTAGEVRYESATNSLSLWTNGVVRMTTNGAGEIGVGLVPTTGKGMLQLPVGTARSSGLSFGADSYLYRTAAGQLKTDGGLTIWDSTATGGLTLGPATGSASIKYNTNGNLDITPRSGYKSVFPSGTVLVGADPGGSSLLRVGTTTAYPLTLNSTNAQGGYLTLSRSGVTNGMIGTYAATSGGNTAMHADGLFLRSANGIGFGPSTGSAALILGPTGSATFSGTIIADKYGANIRIRRDGTDQYDWGVFASGDQLIFRQWAGGNGGGITFGSQVNAAGGMAVAGAVVVGTDPGGSASLRVGGAIHSAETISWAGGGQYAFGAGPVMPGSLGKESDRVVAAGYPVYRLNWHTGLTLSAHSAYGGVRIYNQTYPDPLGEEAVLVASFTDNKARFPSGVVASDATFTGGLNVAGTVLWGQQAPYTYMDAVTPGRHFAYTNPTTNALFSGGTGGLGFNNAADTVRLAQLTDTGNLGVGCSTDVAARFHVAGGAIDRAPLGHETLMGAGAIWTGDSLFVGANARLFMTTGAAGYIGTQSAHDLILRTGYVDRMRIDTNGAVSIGADPGGTEMLRVGGSAAVNGTIRAKEVRVENAGWGDYVFAPDYKLLSLGEVAQHIAQNRHLPGIPSAAEIEKNGMGVSDMVSKQMVKIEELTLYAIQAKQERDAMAAKVDHLEAELAEIRALLRAK